MSDLDRNKQNVIAFYDLVFNRCQPAEAVKRYVGAEYIMHNLRGVNNKQAFVHYFERVARNYPGKRVEFKRVLAEGNYVVVHYFQHWPGGRDYAGIDIFRLTESGAIIEHWDVLQEIPPKAAKLATMF